ncbi:MAG: hypothetical protein K6F99_07320, partial [Lachnospiraceae bacterium]|nr:hypothetical protein [Lachnospiraceae bacterium]
MSRSDNLKTKIDKKQLDGLKTSLYVDTYDFQTVCSSILGLNNYPNPDLVSDETEEELYSD